MELIYFLLLLLTANKSCKKEFHLVMISVPPREQVANEAVERDQGMKGFWEEDKLISITKALFTNLLGVFKDC